MTAMVTDKYGNRYVACDHQRRAYHIGKLVPVARWVPTAQTMPAVQPNYQAGALVDINAPASLSWPVTLLSEPQGFPPMQTAYRCDMSGYIAPAGWMDTLKKYGTKAINFTTAQAQAAAKADAFKESLAMQQQAAAATAPRSSIPPWAIPAAIGIVLLVVLRKK